MKDIFSDYGSKDSSWHGSDAISPKVADVLEKVMSAESGLSHEESGHHYNANNQGPALTKHSHQKEETGLPLLSNLYQNNYCPYPDTSYRQKDPEQCGSSPHYNHPLTPSEKFSYRREETDVSTLPSTDSSGYKTDEDQPRAHNPFQDDYKSDLGTPLPGSYYGDRLSKDHDELNDDSFGRKDDSGSSHYAPGKIGERTPDRSLSRDEDRRESESVHNGSFSRDLDDGSASHQMNNSLNDSYHSDEDSSEALKLGLNETNAEHLLPEDYKSYSFHSANPLASPGYLGNQRYNLPPIPRTKDPTSETYHTPQKQSGLYFCHLCSFSAKYKEDFDAHMSIHFEYSCPHCDYTSRTEGRLKRHIKDFHSNDSEGFGTAKMQRMQPGRPKVYRCKQCSFASTTKVDFWQHSRSHIKEEKLLQCPRCPFVTEYKHHLEYHLRNHFGSKPFKCTKCNYSCVNKSMLNSHMKSHTNVYQYRCADCTYATKYCHSLKLHLKKYNHKPAAVLNADGSLPQGLEPEASGLSLLAKRGPPRGPRGPRKDKMDGFMSPLFHLPQSPMTGMPPGLNGALMSPYWPLLNQLPNGIHPPPPLIPVNSMPGQMKMPHSSTPEKVLKHEPGAVRCHLCSFTAETPEGLNAHVLKVHAAGENQDLFNMFGISSEALLDEHSLKTHIGATHHQTPKDRSSSRSAHNMLHVQTDQSAIKCKTSPQSWASNQGPLSSTNGRSHAEVSYSSNGNKELSSPVEGADILKQMTLKFGGGAGDAPRVRKESPLDLTKPKSVSPPVYSPPSSMHPGFQLPTMNLKRPSTDDISPSENLTEQVASPRKRSRKGKAYKLDTLCLKLQEKQNGSPYESESEDSGSETTPQEYVTETRIDEASPNGRGESPGSLKIDEMKYSPKHNDDDDIKNGTSPISHNNDFEQIHENLKILNNGNKVEKSPTKLNGETNGNLNSKDQNGSSSPDDVSMADLSKEEVENYLHPQKAVPSALRRGAELAWKILNDSESGTAPNGDLTEKSSPSHVHPLGEDTPLSLPHPLAIGALGALGGKGKPFRGADSFECHYCEIAFRDCVMYTMHMGYHGYQDPYKCNMCGHCSRDKVEFFLHIARAAHS